MEIETKQLKALIRYFLTEFRKNFEEMMVHDVMLHGLCRTFKLDMETGLKAIRDNESVKELIAKKFEEFDKIAQAIEKTIDAEALMQETPSDAPVN